MAAKSRVYRKIQVNPQQKMLEILKFTNRFQMGVTLQPEGVRVRYSNGGTIRMFFNVSGTIYIFLS